jgi:hypothetical protein
VRAVADAQPLAEARAVRSAQRRALGLAARAGLTLRGIQAVGASVPDRERYGAVSHCRRVGARHAFGAASVIRMTYVVG